MKVSIIVPFAATNHENHQMGHLWNFAETNYDNIVLSTIEVIRNINKVLCNTNKEIILVDNTHNFPEIYLPNLKIVKGWQGYDKETLQKLPNFQKYNINRSLFLEIDLKNSSAKSEDINFNLEIKESSKKMFLSGEWDATATLLANFSLVEEKIKELPYIKFN